MTPTRDQHSIIRSHTAARIAELLAAVADLGDGSDSLGVIVRQALEDDPRVTSAEVRQIVLDAMADARRPE